MQVPYFTDLVTIRVLYGYIIKIKNDAVASKVIDAQI